MIIKTVGLIIVSIIVLRQMFRTMILNKEYDRFVYFTFVGFVYSLMFLNAI